jgi:hypothetical protein
VLLRFPGRALGAPQAQQPDRVQLLVGPAQDPGDQGSRVQGRRVGDGVQAAEGGPGPLAAVNGPYLVALMRAGACFDKGMMVERPDEDQEAAA